MFCRVAVSACCEPSSRWCWRWPSWWPETPSNPTSAHLLCRLRGGFDGPLVQDDPHLQGGIDRPDGSPSAQLVAATANDRTPLHSALWRAGSYFETDQPWESGETGTDTPLSCRQNFSILTTDGYWNGGSVATALTLAALRADNAVSRLAARAGLNLPGLTYWSLCALR